MTPPPEDRTTSVAVTFVNPDNSSSTSNLTATIYDNRNNICVNVSVQDPSKYVKAVVCIDTNEETNPTTLASHSLKIGPNFIGTVLSVGPSDIRYAFADGVEYSIKIKALLREGTSNSVISFDSKFTWGSQSNAESYQHIHMDNGGTTFVQSDCYVQNPNEIENGSTIELNVPLDTSNDHGLVPHSMVFVFDEADNYPANATDNSESLSSYCVEQAYESSGEYILENNELTNDSIYACNVTAIYSDGHTTSVTLPVKLYVIAKPVISSITAYGLGVDQTDADDDEIAQVMDVYMSESGTPVNIPTANGDIRFEFRQGDDTYYSATLPVSTTQESDNTIKYTITKEDLTQEWSTTAPTQNEDGSYTYNIVAILEYDAVSGSDNIVKTSDAVEKTFTSDIIPLPSVEAFNAWILASVTTVDGQDQVDLADPVSDAGYTAAPETAIVVRFKKHNYYGSGKTDGFHQDLDAVDGDGNPVTNHKFMIKVNDGEFQPVQRLHQILGDPSKNDRENATDAFSAPMLENEDGVYPNIPGPSGVPGSSQEYIYALICGPSEDYEPYTQGDSVVVSVQILGPGGEVTIPEPTSSNEHVVVNKINQYEMTVCTDSEPTFIDDTIRIPINNPNTQENELYFASVNVTSNLASPNDDVTVDISNDGVFDVELPNPDIRGAGSANDINYQVRYIIADPNNVESTIMGPVSAEYTIHAKDEPTSANFLVSNYEYKIFNDESESSFTFDIDFYDVGTTSINGVHVYFESDNDDATASNDISRTLVYDVKRSDGDNQTNILVTLQTTGPETSAVTDGVKIQDINGNDSENLWLNFSSGTLSFVPYYTAQTECTDVPIDEHIEVEDAKHEEDIYNVPVIDVVNDVTLVGGALEAFTGTQVEWTNELNQYDERPSVTATHDLSVNTQDQSSGVVDDSEKSYYDIDLGNAVSSYTVEIRVKIVTGDGEVYLSEAVTVTFDSVSVDQSGMTITVLRGSNNVNLRASHSDYTADPSTAASLNVEEVQLVHNENGSHDPEDEGVVLLNCTTTSDDIQPDGTALNYDISSFALGDELKLQMRMKVGCDYTVTYSGGIPENKDSVATYLSLETVPTKNYIVATKPEVTIGPTYQVVSGGPNDENIALFIKIDAKGLHKEGVESCVCILAQEGDYTNENDGDGQGKQVVISFSSTADVPPTYDQQADAIATFGSGENIAANETVYLTIETIDGIEEPNGQFVLVTDDLTSSDESTLYIPPDAGFDNTKPITFVIICSTKLGITVANATVTPF